MIIAAAFWVGKRCGSSGSSRVFKLGNFVFDFLSLDRYCNGFDLPGTSLVHSRASSFVA